MDTGLVSRRTHFIKTCFWHSFLIGPIQKIMRKKIFHNIFFISCSKVSSYLVFKCCTTCFPFTQSKIKCQECWVPILFPSEKTYEDSGKSNAQTEIAESQYMGVLALLLHETILRTLLETHMWKTVNFKIYLPSSISLVPSKQHSERVRCICSLWMEEHRTTEVSTFTCKLTPKSMLLADNALETARSLENAKHFFKK